MSESGIPEKYKVDHLILLVGGNPLPNAVAGRLLVKPGGQITLIHTDSTKQIADRLKTWLNEQEMGAIVNQPRETDRTRKSKIFATIERTIQPNETSVGLHYTGGTAAMAVHAHTAVQARADKPVFSYLDASTLCINFDDDQTHRPLYVGLRPPFALTINDLFTLHGWYIHEKQPEVLLPAVAEALYQGYSTASFIAGNDPPNFIRQSRDWVAHNFNRIGKENGRWKDEDTLSRIEAEFPEIGNLGHAMREVIPASATDGNKFLVSSGQELGFKTSSSFCEWFNGMWFEAWVMQKLLQLQNSHDLTEIYSGVRASPDVNPRRGDPEFDVVAMRGYQLFFLSCTITDPVRSGARAALKGKLFEAYVRARQLAGSEVCVALICGADDSDYPDSASLEVEMQQTLQVEGRIKVFGRKKLPALDRHLSHWIKEQSREGQKCP